MKVTITTLEMLTAPSSEPRQLPDDVRVERAAPISAEYARFLYGLVGGPWFWTERLGWTRQQWIDELAVPGTEFWILYGGGNPLGYVQLQPQPGTEGTEAEIRYFGLVEDAMGRGLGGRLLEHGIAAAWSLPQRSALAPVARVWVHTCSLDGPAALPNYQARGFVVVDEKDVDEDLPERPHGSWASTCGGLEV